MVMFNWEHWRSQPWGFGLGLVVLLSVLFLLQFGLRQMPITGDEPGYMYTSLSVATAGDFSLPMAQFAQAMPRFADLVRDGFTPIAGHPVLMSVLGAPG